MIRRNAGDADFRARERSRAQIKDRLQAIIDGLRSGALTQERVVMAARLGSPEAIVVTGPQQAIEWPRYRQVCIAALADRSAIANYTCDVTQRSDPSLEMMRDVARAVYAGGSMANAVTVSSSAGIAASYAAANRDAETAWQRERLIDYLLGEAP